MMCRQGCLEPRAIASRPPGSHRARGIVARAGTGAAGPARACAWPLPLPLPGVLLVVLAAAVVLRARAPRGSAARVGVDVDATGRQAGRAKKGRGTRHVPKDLTATPNAGTRQGQK